MPYTIFHPPVRSYVSIFLPCVTNDFQSHNSWWRSFSLTDLFPHNSHIIASSLGHLTCEIRSAAVSHRNAIWPYFTLLNRSLSTLQVLFIHTYICVIAYCRVIPFFLSIYPYIKNRSERPIDMDHAIGCRHWLGRT